MTALAVARQVRELYADDLLEDEGVLQVSSGWLDAQGVLHSIRIGPQAPRSATDGFALGLARARADIIVTTGRILRDEPELVHEIASDPRLDLSAWRREHLRRSSPPEVAVLTSGRALDWNHPVFSRASRVSIFTGEDQRRALATEAKARGVKLITDPEPTLEGLLAYLGTRHEVRTVTLEVGPSTVASLYAGGGHVQEWMLSACLAETIAQEVVGDPWPDSSQRLRAGLRLRSERRLEEESGPWAFQRFR